MSLMEKKIKILISIMLSNTNKLEKLREVLSKNIKLC